MIESDAIYQAEPALADEQRMVILDALGLSLAAKRREAMAARTNSGIEQIWDEDEAHYQGYDDANRHEFRGISNKPSASGASRDMAPKRRGSTVFPNITQPYVDAAAARVGDMLLPTDDRNFALEPTPIPDLSEGLATYLPQLAPSQPPGMPPAMGGQPPAPQGVPPGMPPQQGAMPPGGPPAPMARLPDGQMVPVTQLAQAFEKMKSEAQRKAEKAQEQIDDWLMECQYHAEVRKVIDDAAKLGSGVLKGPVPMVRKSMAWRKGEGDVTEIEITEEIKPGSRRIDPWNLFPDGACGENLHDGSYVFERDYITGKKLDECRALGYIEAQLDLVMDEGPKSATASESQGAERKGQYEIWYYHGYITAEELIAAGVDVDEAARDSYPAMITMVNDRVVHAALNPLDAGLFPYDIIPWKRQPGMPWGVGVARQMRTPQRIVTAATRNLMDNAGLGAGPQVIVRRGIEPQDGNWEITPLKVWIETDESDGQAPTPFFSVTIPMLQVELMNIIQMGQKLAEDTTGLPQLLQGQQGQSPDTVGGMTILNNNANSVLRRIARLFDSCITEPHIRRYYTWLMEHGDDDDVKGDFQIVARGSSALIERDTQRQVMTTVVQMCLNPAFGKNPARAMDEFLKSMRFDPDAFEYTDEERAEQAQKQPQPPPQIAVAQIRAQAEMQKAQFMAQNDAQRLQAVQQLEMQKLQAEQQLEMQRLQTETQTDMQIAGMREQTQQTRIKVDTDRDTAYVTAERERNQAEHQARMMELNVKRELEMLKYANTNQVTLDKIKADLTKESMRLRTQKELSQATNAMKAPQVARPAVEPAGRAPNGQAFQR